MQLRARARPFHAYLAIIGSLGLVTRILLERTERPFRALTDESWFVMEARSLFGAHPFTQQVLLTNPVVRYPTAMHGPLGVFLVAPVTWFFPAATSNLRFVSIMVGTATVIAFGLVARRFGGDRVGLIAAVVAALTPDLWMSSGVVGDDALASLLFVCVVGVTYAALEHWSWQRGIALGALLGLLTLCFTGSVELAAVLLIGLAWRHRGAAGAARLRGLAASIAAGVVLVAVLAPWLAFNYHRFDGRLVLTTELGQTLAQSNNQATYYRGPEFGYQTIFAPPVAATPAQQLDEPTMDRLFRDHALSYARKHLARLLYVLPLRALWEWSLWRPGYVAQREVLMGFAPWAGDVQAVGTWMLLGLAAVGLSLLRRRRSVLWPLVSLLVLATVNGVAFTPSYRYRLGGIIALVLLSAVAIEHGCARLALGRHASNGIPAMPGER